MPSRARRILARRLIAARLLVDLTCVTVPPKTQDVLIAAAESPAMTTLLAALTERGIACDLVHTLAQAREVFLTRGGHALFVVGPGMTPATTRTLVGSLTTVDPDLRVAVFEDPREHESSSGSETAHAIPYHPSSRAAVGAILKLLHGI